jgi:hypothetical protein
MKNRIAFVFHANLPETVGGKMWNNFSCDAYPE